MAGNIYDTIPDDEEQVAPDNVFDSIPVDEPVKRKKNVFDEIPVDEPAAPSDLLLPDSARRVQSVNPDVVGFGGDLAQPTGVPKDILSSPLSYIQEPFNMAGRALNAGVTDVANAAAKLNGIPNAAEWGENTRELITRPEPLYDPKALPQQRTLAEISKSNPVAATAGKIAGGLVQSAPMLAAMPQGALGRLVAAGFTADMFHNAVGASKTLGEEMGKNPEDRDHDKITSSLSEIIQGAAFSGLGGAHLGGEGIRGLASKLKSEPISTPPPIKSPGERTQNANSIQKPVEVFRGETPGVAAQVAEGKPGEVQQATGAPLSGTPDATVVEPKVEAQKVSEPNPAQKKKLDDLTDSEKSAQSDTRHEDEMTDAEYITRERGRSKIKRVNHTNKEAQLLREAGVEVPDEFLNPSEDTARHITGWARDKNGNIQVRVEHHTKNTSSAELITVRSGDTLSWNPDSLKNEPKPAVEPKVEAQKVETPVEEDAARRYDRLKAEKAAGTLTDPEKIAQLADQDARQNAVKNSMQAEFEKLKAAKAAKASQESPAPAVETRTAKDPTKMSRQELKDAMDMLHDSISTKKSNKQEVPQAWIDRLGKLRESYLEEQPEQGDHIYTRQDVYGHPENSIDTEPLLPIKLPIKESSFQSIESASKGVQILRDKAAKLLNTKEGISKIEAMSKLDDLQATSKELARIEKIIAKRMISEGMIVPDSILEKLPDLKSSSKEAVTKNAPETITGSNEGKASEMPADSGATPKPEQSSSSVKPSEAGKSPEDIKPPVVETPPETPVIGEGPGAATAGAEASQQGTTLANASGELERISQGLPEPFPTQRKGMAEAWVKSGDVLVKDPQAGQKLADELKHNPERGMTDEDSALLLRHKVALENAKNQAAEDTITAKTFEAKAEAQARFEDASNKLLDLLDAAKFRGSQWGREGRWRQALAFEDFSLETMRRDKSLSKDRELTPKENEEVKAAYEKIKELQRKLAEKTAADKSGKQNSAVDESVKDSVSKSKSEESKEKANGETRDIEAEKKEAIEFLGESHSENGNFSESTSAIKKLMELFARQGITERVPMEDAVWDVLKKIEPEITREQTLDLMSGYGKSKLPNPDVAKRTVRDITAQILSVRKLLDYWQGQRPKLTGQLRDAPSEIQRGLLKVVNEAKKAFKLDGPTDSAKAVKSALDAVNTRLKNRIADLKSEIVTRRKIINEKSPSPYNEETLRLRKELEETKKQHDEIFGTEMSDAKRLELTERATERQIQELERQIKTGEIFPKGKVENNLRSEKLDAARARLEELKATRKFAREASQPRPEREVLANEAKIRALDKQIEAIQTQLKNDEVFSKSKKTPDPVTDKRILERQARLEELKKEREYARQRNQPGLEPEAAFLLNYELRLRRRAAQFSDRLARGDFEKKKRKEPPRSPDIDKASFELMKEKTAWHEAMMQDRLAKRSTPKKIFDTGVESLNTSRAILTSGDFSALLRQGGWLSVIHPIRASKSIPAMFRAFASKEGQHRINEEIISRPNYPLYQQAKLYLSNHGQKLSQMEEAYMSRWADKIPFVAGSERAYTTFLNKLRADSFDAMAKSLSRNKELTPIEANAIANYVNVVTGRGSIGMKANALVGLNTVFFAPRYAASRFQILAGQPMYRGTARTRILIASEYGRFLIGAGLIYSLGQMAGADIELDPRSTDFGKMKFGNTRLDMLSGLAQATTLVSRLTSGEIKNPKGKIIPIRGKDVPYGGTDSASLIGRFLRGKLSPVFGTALNVSSGKDVVGQPVTPESTAKGLLVPLSFQDILSTMMEQGIPRGTALSLLSIFGAGLQNYDSKKNTPAESKSSVLP